MARKRVIAEACVPSGVEVIQLQAKDLLTFDIDAQTDIGALVAERLVLGAFVRVRPKEGTPDYLVQSLKELLAQNGALAVKVIAAPKVEILEEISPAYAKPVGCREACQELLEGCASSDKEALKALLERTLQGVGL